VAAEITENTPHVRGKDFQRVACSVRAIDADPNGAFQQAAIGRTFHEDKRFPLSLQNAAMPDVEVARE